MEVQGSYQGEAPTDLSDFNLSDVIAVIAADPDIFKDTMAQPATMTNGFQESTAPYVEILEHPAPKALRFRYECEGRSAGSIPGANSTADNKTYPTIQVKNYVGRAVVVVSCVTKDAPHKPHPHNLVGREGCKKGVCTLEINTDDMKMVFSNLGIQCVKKRDIEEALRAREEIRVDPYRTGYSHRNQPASIDLNAVRLCFQVFLEGPQKGKFSTPLKPVVSDTIFDKKSMSDLTITKLSHCNAACNGGQEMILLCEKVAKEDIAILFYEDVNNGWEGHGEFSHSQVHKQVAISFRTPRFRSIEITEPVRVKIQLRRPSDGATSEPLDFEMLPLNEDDLLRKAKKHKLSEDNGVLHAFKKSPAHDPNFGLHNFKAINDQQQAVKVEPRDQNVSPGYNMFPGGNYRDPGLAATPSPQPELFNNNLTPSPLPYGNLLQHQFTVQARDVTIPNFQQIQSSHIFNPAMNTNTAMSFTNGNSTIWNNNNLNDHGPSSSRNYPPNIPGMQTFNQPLTPINPTTVGQNEVRVSSSNLLMDLDSQIFNLSGDLGQISLTDLGADFAKIADPNRANNS